MPRGKKKFQAPTPQAMPSLGKMIALHLRKHRINASKLSTTTLQRHVSALAKFKKRPSFQAAILWELSHALHHNFFMDLAMQLPQDYAQDPHHFADKIEALQLEIHNLRIENALLEKLMKK
jgi:hypothetical protein